MVYALRVALILIFLLSSTHGRSIDNIHDRFAKSRGSAGKSVISLIDAEVGQPNTVRIRQKRGSDQRLAEIETLHALSKLSLIATTSYPLHTFINKNFTKTGRLKRITTNSNRYRLQNVRRRKKPLNEILISTVVEQQNSTMDTSLVEET